MVNDSRLVSPYDLFEKSGVQGQVNTDFQQAREIQKDRLNNILLRNE